MTFTDTNSIEQAAKAFRRLNVDEQMKALAALYSEAADALRSAASSVAPSKNVAELIGKVKQLREENQLQFIQDVLSQKGNQQEEVALDPHPSKALLELVPGAGAPPISQYNDLSDTDRLVFWYQLAQQMGGAIAAPASYQPSEQVAQVLSALKSADLEQKIAFLKQVV